MNRIIFFFAFIGIIVMSCTTSPSYHEDDKEGLRMFLRQPSAKNSKLNAEQLGLAISDTLDWQNSEKWVRKINGLVWNNESPKRLIEISAKNRFDFRNFNEGWSKRNLAGNLDASKWSKLTTLKCDGNQLTALDVSANTELDFLLCSWNQLTALDVNSNRALTVLYCSNNQLTELDLSKNTALTDLYCFHNQLIVLDVSSNTALTNLNCSDNQLAELIVRATNTALTWVRCSNNRLPISNLLAVSERITDPYYKELGAQNLLPKTIKINNEIDFSSQNIFKGIYTKFAVIKDENPENTDDYTITDGKITFHTLSNYTLTMTNEAIKSSEEYPAKVIIKIEVVD